MKKFNNTIIIGIGHGYGSAPMQKQAALKPITVISVLRSRTSHRSCR